MAYSAESDMLLGDIALPPYLAKSKYVQDAADEMDSKIGFVYATPVDLSTLKRPAQLLLKRLNNFLATGRLILAMNMSEEDNALHAYGKSLVDEANLALEAIRTRDMVLEGAALTPEATEGESNTSVRVLQYTKDDESLVDSYYEKIANPNYSFGIPGLRPYTGEHLL